MTYERIMVQLASVTEDRPLTHADVMQEYAQSANPNPELLSHMQGLAQEENAAQRQPRPIIKEVAETALTEYAEKRVKSEVRAAESALTRVEVTPRLHDEHVPKASLISDFRRSTVPEQDFIDEILGVGQGATTAQSGGALGSKYFTAADREKMNDHQTDESFTNFTQACELTKHMVESMEMNIGPGTRVMETVLQLIASAEWDNVSAEKVDALIGYAAMYDRTFEPLGDGNEDVMKYSLTHNILKSAPDSILATLYKVPLQDGSPSELRDFIDTRKLTKNRAMIMGSVLGHIHIADNVNILLMPEGHDENIDKLRQYIDFAHHEIATIPNKPGNVHDLESIIDHDKKVTDIMRDVFRNKLKIDSTLLDKMGTAMMARLRHTKPDEKIPYFDGEDVRESLYRIKAIAENTSQVALEKLTIELGVTNLDMYIPSDLDTLTGLIDRDEAMIEHLQGGDVTVVFVDAFGDHNGALTPSFDTYRKASGRTLMFEVAKPGDFYRRMVLLKRLGIKPSTIVIAGHGSPGVTQFGQKDSNFTLATNRYVSQEFTPATRVNMDETQIERLASDEFMQSSRGIDDPEERIGRRTFILNSCSSDKAYEGALPSSIETIVRMIGRLDVVGYGAASDMYLQSSGGSATFVKKIETPNGLTFYKPNGQEVSLTEHPSIVHRVKAKLGERKLLVNGQNVSDQVHNKHLSIIRTSVKTIRLHNGIQQNGSVG
jgi:hypothetical protein